MSARWLKEAEDDDGQAFRGNEKLISEQSEIRRLKEHKHKRFLLREGLKTPHLDR
jgi:transposase-like protein